MSVKILIADDHSVVRTGLMHLIQGRLFFREVASVSNCNGLLKAIRKDSYSHLILDMSLPDGVSTEILPVIRHLCPHINILLFSMYDRVIYEKILSAYGIYDYLEKSGTDAHILQVIHRFLNHQHTGRPAAIAPSPSPNPFQVLTERQLQVLHYLVSGCTTKEIAARLNIHMNTVSTTKNRIYEKTGAANASELIHLAIRYKML